MLRTSIEINNTLKRKIAWLRETAGGAEALIKKAVEVSAITVANSAKQIAPVASGALADSIAASFSTADRGMSATVGSPLPYAAKWEYSEVPHPVRERGEISRGPNKGRLRPPVNTNPLATWGFLRKSLSAEARNFRQNLQDIVNKFKGLKNA